MKYDVQDPNPSAHRCPSCKKAGASIEPDIPVRHAASESMRLVLTWECGAVWRSPAGLAKKAVGEQYPPFRVRTFGPQSWLELKACPL